MATTAHDHVLRDGTTVRIRQIRPDDKERLLAMWERTSEESRRRRFLGPFRLAEDNVHRFTDLDDDQFALVATLGRREDERIIGVARYARDDGDGAEFAALVEDAHQGRGVGTALMRNLATAAAERGVRTLTGDILSNNTRMLNLVRDLGLEYHRARDERDGSVVRADVGIELSDAYLDVVAEADREAARAALTRFFAPERIAVVGASRDRRSIGGLVFDNLLAGSFAGVVYPVNRSSPWVQGVAAYPTLSDCPDTPDLVIVCVPAPAVAGVVDEAGRLGVRAVCIISAGFSEAGDEGERRHEELMDIARGHGLRVVGPNCMGVMNASEDVRMNGTFSRIFPRPGRLAFSSQSGALGLAVLEHAHRLDLGISTFVSVGNKADISGNDLLQYWEDDGDTDVMLLYLESFGNPRKFSRIARRISRRKPIVAVKSGRTSAGVRAASSHTAAISSGDVAVDALFRQTGVIRTDTLQELFDVATLLSNQPLPAGGRVAILTNAGGPGILAADALESNGLEVPRLAARTREQLLEFLPPEAGLDNPVDMIASATAPSYRRALHVLGNAEEIDAVFAIFIPAGTTGTHDVAEAIAAGRREIPEQVPVVSVFMSPEERVQPLAEASIPAFTFPEDAARALGRVARYAEWRRQPLGKVVEPEGVDPDRARAVVETALADADDPDEGVWLSQRDAEEVLRAYGVPLARSRVVSSGDEAAETQREIGGPVAVKVAAPIHKTDVGGLVLDIASPDAAREAVESLQERLHAEGLSQHADEFLVQEMVDGVVEMVVGVSHDPSFGPIVMTGLGGTLVELLRDVAVRITPLTDLDIEDMLSSLKMKPLLQGYRGAEPADVGALKELLCRVNAMVEDLPEVMELDLNPVFVREDGRGVRAVDVRMKVAA